MTIRLVELRELSLWGESRLVKDVRFDLPSLQELQVHNGDSFQFPTNLSPKVIHWSLRRPDHEPQTPDTIQAALKVILQSSSQVQVVTIPEFAGKYCSVVLHGLQMASILPASLRTVVVDQVGGEKALIDVTHIDELIDSV
ncbi:hypothetical protein M408DRAFT_21286 [Serendipita vermifera MAFF 305830]|uniref:Uncharacterized protein n=1 Tax=Serendipita vermifera MAFF 305830 TaxID=933852 RepID=A0A0C2XQI6_SERVB|nr:hypothetical protein M408DRAFT_21286 [Serendipita vermifera MAFF 305830]